MLKRWWGLPGGWLFFIGTGLTDYLDILVRKGWEAPVNRAGVQTLGRIGPWKLADLHQLSPGGAALELCRKWPGPRTYRRQDGFPVINVKPWEELLMCVSTRLRKNARRTLRQADEEGVQCVLPRLDEAEQAARRLIALHREMLRGKDINPEHLTEKFECYLVAAARRLAELRLGGVYEFWREGEVVASHFLLFGPDFVGDYLVGAKPESLQHYQMHSLYTWNAVNVARTRGSTRVNLLRGEEPYKLRWASKVIYNYQAVLSRKPILGNRSRIGAHRPVRPRRRHPRRPRRS